MTSPAAHTPEQAALLALQEEVEPLMLQPIRTLRISDFHGRARK